MTAPSPSPAQALRNDDEISLLALASVLLRWRRTIIVLGLVGAAMGLALGITSTRVYTSVATFIPEASDAGASGLALAASQLGLRMPSSGGGAWGPQVYVELLTSQAVLEPIALDTVVVAEEGGRRVALMDLLKVTAPSPARRIELAIRALRGVVSASVDRNLGAVRVLAATRWPSVSLALAQRLVDGVSRFNLETRQSQAAAERRFVEGQAREAERALRDAEDQLQMFLQRNRAMANSPELGFQRDRLQRDVALRQQVYTSLVQSLEDARIREVRDTPVITVLESPRLPLVGESRKSVQKGVVGGLAGGGLGVLVAFCLQALAGARRAPSEGAREFFRLVEEITPHFLRRRSSES